MQAGQEQPKCPDLLYRIIAIFHIDLLALKTLAEWVSIALQNVCNSSDNLFRLVESVSMGKHYICLKLLPINCNPIFSFKKTFKYLRTEIKIHNYLLLY